MDKVINYVRGTAELREKTFRALKLIQEFNRANYDDLEKQEKIISNVISKLDNLNIDNKKTLEIIKKELKKLI